MTWSGAVITAIAATACAQVKPPPQLAGVEPAKVPAGVTTPVLVRGSNFFGELHRNEDGQFTSDLEFAIIIVGADVQLVGTFNDTDTLATTLPATLAAGSYDVVVDTPSGAETVLADALRVVSAHVVIEDAPGGAGTEVGDRQLPLGAELQFYAVSRFDDDGSFIGDEVVGWSMTGNAGSIDVTEGSSTAFTASAVGTSQVSASHTVFGADTTGQLEVVAGSCGDTFCTGTEDTCSCPDDCGTMCGDGCCNGGENELDCPQDCSCATCTMGTCQETCTGDCTLECNSPCACSLDCAETTGTCMTSCDGGEICTVDCANVATCQPRCAGDSQCMFANCGSAGTCDARCTGNALCTIDCSGGADCTDSHCTGSAQCLLDCTGASSCGYAECDGVELNCPNNIIACNRPCPSP